MKNLKVLKSLLGDNILDDLRKSEIYKPETKTALDPEDIRVALQIVPRAVLTFLFSNLKYHDQNEPINLDIPWHSNSRIMARKHGADNYSGELIKDNKRVLEFKNRSLPSVGLLILTAFELYDLDLLNEIKQPRHDMPDAKEAAPQNNRMDELQALINEKLLLQQMVSQVVDKKLQERDAIDKIISEKLHAHVVELQPVPQISMQEDKKSKLKEFLKKIEQKKQEPVSLDKSIDIKCPDCRTTIFKNNTEEIKPCVCFGEHCNKSIKIIKKSDGRVSLKFPKAFDIDNVEMLLEAISKKK